MKFTTVVGIDEEHLKEWMHTRYAIAHKAPELLRNVLFIVDVAMHSETITKLLSKGVRNPPSFAWTRIGRHDGQRDYMLTNLTTLPHRHVKTEWFLKWDTDAIPVGPLRIPKAVKESACVLAAPKWGYTKPASMMEDMAMWLRLQPEFCGHDDRFPEYTVDEKGRAKHPRIISYFAWIRTDWSREINDRYLIDKTLPIPSQDTFLWNMAQMRKDPVERLRGDDKGWVVHRNGLRRISETVEQVLKGGA